MLKNYLKTAIKVLWRHKLFTFISLFGISFTLLILVVATSFVDHIFGPVAPEKKLDRTLSVTTAVLVSKTGGIANGPLLSYHFLNKYVKNLKTPEKISISSFHSPVVVYNNKNKINFDLKFIDGEFWEILDFKFLEGRPFSTDDVTNRTPVAVINEDLRKQYFGDAPAIGNTINADGTNFRVLGVVKNVSLMRIMPYSDMWVPLTFSKVDFHKPTLMQFPGWFAMVLAHSRSDLPAIRREFDQHLTLVEYPDDRWKKIITGTSTYAEAVTRNIFRNEDDSSTPLLTFIFVLIILFMLLPTVNLVNINLSRIMERSSEIGIRRAFGATSLTLIGQFITENVIITLIGGGISLLLSLIVIAALNNSGMIPHLHMTMNFRIFFTSLSLALLFGLLSGVYPAYKMSCLNPVEALRGDQK
ncbi:MAG: ABC transporter permease [Candidatus Marinimicrobia bacterium]|nr:ABC transporter permease [Candidatus Neomarinimicrobiota bacterium]